jgi:calcineurin-like phosphoesterase family protein
MRRKILLSLLAPALVLFAALALIPSAQTTIFGKNRPASGGEPAWSFAVSGDSRNCGDVVMPAIAEGVKQQGASFYWHLGDFRALYNFDEDIQHEPEHLARPLSISDYEQVAWDDFLKNQIAPFAPVPVFLGIGNHETVPPHTRELYLIQFADWLEAPKLREQRLHDDPRAHRLTAFYHWIERGVDFINLDNATEDQFDDAQLAWFEKVMQADAASPEVRTIVVGMHKALPDSISKSHSMNESPAGTESGRRVYRDLLKVQNDGHKRVYVLASHSHYFMDGIFNTEYWRANGGALPGWIVGTAGAVRYKLSEDRAGARAAETNVYGFLLGSVKTDGEIDFAFQRIRGTDVPAAVVERFTPAFVHWCFAENSSAH